MTEERKAATARSERLEDELVELTLADQQLDQARLAIGDAQARLSRGGAKDTAGMLVGMGLKIGTVREHVAEVMLAKAGQWSNDQRVLEVADRMDNRPPTYGSHRKA